MIKEAFINAVERAGAMRKGEIDFKTWILLIITAGMIIIILLAVRPIIGLLT